MLHELGHDGDSFLHVNAADFLSMGSSTGMWHAQMELA